MKMADAVVEPAPGDENDDSWLYGDSNPEQGDGNKSAETNEATQPSTEEGVSY